VFGDWVFIETDFRREYGIDLVTDLEKMSWRKFWAYIRGLSANSALVSVIQARKEGSAPIEDPQQAERAVKQVWG